MLGAVLGGAAGAATGLPTATTAHAASWQQKWAPSASADGLGAFETVEDDRADSHPAAHPHIYATGDNWRFNIHTVDRDTSTDRQRQEVTGLRNGSGGNYLKWTAGSDLAGHLLDVHPELAQGDHHLHPHHADEAAGQRHLTARRAVAAPGERRADHRTQAGRRRHPGRPHEPGTAARQWTDVDFQIKVGNGSAGTVRWILKSGGSTVIDASKTGVDTFLADRVRPKWGIYRSLGDTSGPCATPTFCSPTSVATN